jgi:hypothetical protein
MNRDGYSNGAGDDDTCGEFGMDISDLESESGLGLGLDEESGVEPDGEQFESDGGRCDGEQCESDGGRSVAQWDGAQSNDGSDDE